MSQGQGCSIFTHSRCMKWRSQLDFQDVKEMKSQDSMCTPLTCKVNNMAKNVKKTKSQSLTWIIPQPEDAVLHTLLSWLKEEALFGHHHSVPCILNRVEIGKFWHYGLKCGRGGWHRPPESQIGLNSFLPPTRWFCPTLLMNMMMGRCAQLGPCQAHTVLTIKYRGSLSSRPRLTALESNIE